MRKNLLTRIEKLEERKVPCLSILAVCDGIVSGGRFGGLKIDAVPERSNHKIIEITFSSLLPVPILLFIVNLPVDHCWEILIISNRSLRLAGIQEQYGNLRCEQNGVLVM